LFHTSNANGCGVGLLQRIDLGAIRACVLVDELVGHLQFVDDARGANRQSGRLFDTSSLDGALDSTPQCDATLLDQDIHIACAS
jgi:hypothetical protein